MVSLTVRVDYHHLAALTHLSLLHDFQLHLHAHRAVVTLHPQATPTRTAPVVRITGLVAGAAFYSVESPHYGFRAAPGKLLVQQPQAGVVTLPAYPVHENWRVLEFTERGWKRVLDGAAGIRAIKACSHISILRLSGTGRHGSRDAANPSPDRPCCPTLFLFNARRGKEQITCGPETPRSGYHEQGFRGV